ncbi:MAG: hypothetical protein CSA65_01300 [Proteobacteria bacterium]|nr:MAG: hypothetical protein CSB49_00240 [Pseudomonadota bacterium]PIE19725.1 MAG: hypothetical protein CSA65_01300 [Pseudomonadota bacterium]
MSSQGDSDERLSTAGDNPSGEPPLASMETLPPGTLLAERFELYRHLGDGSIASTYLAVEHCGCGLRRLATAKLLKPAIVDDRGRLASILANGRSLAASTSPHLVALRGAFIDGDESRVCDEEPFIASDYVAGESLLTILARCTQLERPPPTPIALRIAADACAGLRALHAGCCGAPLLHHALRPANLLVAYDGHACLADAGIAATPSQLLSDAALSVGLAQFIAPELLPEAAVEVFDDPVGPTTDIYALGAALYVMVTLRFPFDDKQLGELIATKQQAGAIPARKRRGAVPADLEALLTRSLSAMADQRQQSADELGAELLSLIGGADEVAEHRDVASWLSELFAEQLPSKQQVLRKLLWPNEEEAQVVLTPPPQRALPTTKVEAPPNEEPTRASLTAMPATGHVSFGKAIPRDEVSTGLLPESETASATRIQTKLEAPSAATSLTSGHAPLALVGSFADPPQEEDTAVSALQEALSDPATIGRERSSNTHGAHALPLLTNAGTTPEPEPAFGHKPDPLGQPEGDTIRAAKPAREWNATEIDLTTIPFDDTDEKTDVGQLPTAEDGGDQQR